ncbi:hypothetical protein [Methylomonas sp. MgM2]
MTYLNLNKLALAGVIGTLLTASGTVSAHVTYNTNGAPDNSDGSNAGPWTEGDPGYTGNLPATWVAMIHNAGGVANSQTASSADAGFTIGMGAKSYKDGGTNWAHSADFGLFHLQHAADVTISVTADGSNLRPAFGLWDGWDTNSGSSRHQAYLNNGALNPMGSVLDSSLAAHSPTSWAVAPGQGAGQTATLSLFLEAGDYTLILGGYEGTVAGANLAYTATIAAAASPVPLPGAVWLFGGALAGWVGTRRRRASA